MEKIKKEKKVKPRYNKYHNIKSTVNGVEFSSKMEAAYYEFLLNTYKPEEIILQPKFLLQEGFKKNGTLIRKIEYIGDFQIKGSKIVIDVKGFLVAPEFKIKYKLFQNKYPDLDLQVITKAPANHSLQWIPLDEAKKIAKEKKKLKNNK